MKQLLIAQGSRPKAHGSELQSMILLLLKQINQTCLKLPPEIFQPFSVPRPLQQQRFVCNGFINRFHLFQIFGNFHFTVILFKLFPVVF